MNDVKRNFLNTICVVCMYPALENIIQTLSQLKVVIFFLPFSTLRICNMQITEIFTKIKDIGKLTTI
jgi:hypothetical protein